MVGAFVDKHICLLHFSCCFLQRLIIHSTMSRLPSLMSWLFPQQPNWIKGSSETRYAGVKIIRKKSIFPFPPPPIKLMGSHQSCLETGIYFNYDGTITKCKGASCYFWNRYSCRVIEREDCTDHTDELISYGRNHTPDWMGYEMLPPDFPLAGEDLSVQSADPRMREVWICSGSTDTCLEVAPICAHLSEEWWILLSSSLITKSASSHTYSLETSV